MRKLAFIAVFVQLCVLANAQSLTKFIDGNRIGYKNEKGQIVIRPIYTSF